MALKWLPHYTDWDKALAASKLKADQGVRRVLEEFWKLDTDHYDKRLATLPRLARVAGDFRKSRELVAAGGDAAKMAAELVEVIPKVRREVELQKKDFQANAASPVDVQIIVVDWNGRPFEGAKGYAVFQSPGVPKITKGAMLSANGMDIDDVRLRNSGTLNLTIYPGSGEGITGTTDYEFKPGKAVVKFKAVQHSQPYKTRAKTLDEATRKFGFKGSVGTDFRVVKVGGEVVHESQYRETWEDEVEWQLQAGVPTFKEFKQL